MPSEQAQTRAWVLREAPVIPDGLASCFAWQVTQGHDKPADVGELNKVCLRSRAHVSARGTVVAQRCFLLFLQTAHPIDVLAETRPPVTPALHDGLPDMSDVESRLARHVRVHS